MIIDQTFMLNQTLLTDLRKALVYLNEVDWRQAGFNMGYWASYKKPRTRKLGCGTACCAFGVGTTLPSWKRAGLRLLKEEFGFEEIKYYAEVTTSKDILGLTDKQWSYIFGVSTYRRISENISPGDVIVHIDKVLDGAV